MDNSITTMEYYKEYAEEFYESTIDADVEPLYERFLKYIPDSGQILDFGCGSGRDTKYFADQGYEVDAIDGSPELCKMASEYSGIVVKCMDFFELEVESKYDAIWACASLLHVDRERLSEIFGVLKNALVMNGYLYASFKYGDYKDIRDGRYFVDLNEDSLTGIISSVQGFEIVEMWQSQDVRRGKDVDWINVILKKV